jgi:O-acetyl-ADP-ribose deacetylase (regulator of RNase III)
MPFFTIVKDITTMKVDAIVNAANNELAFGGGVCGAIFRGAGVEDMTRACAKVSPVPTGQAVMTPGFKLPAKYVIHTPGPLYTGAKEDATLLASCYHSALKLAEEKKLESIAFPLISAGIYGYPEKEAREIARTAIIDFLKESDTDMTVYLTLLSKPRLRRLPSIQRLIANGMLTRPDGEMDELKSEAIEANEEMEAIRSIPEEEMLRSIDTLQAPSKMPPVMKKSLFRSPKDQIGNLPFELDIPFSKALTNLIDEKGMTDPEVYKAANIDRRLFSKIRNPKYVPKKKTILALAVGLRLTTAETEALLEYAGYSLSKSQMMDVIVRYFLSRRVYDIYKINDALLAYDQQQLGGA